MKRKISILLTSVGGPFMGATLAALRSSDQFLYTLYGVDVQECPPVRSLLDGYAQVPMGDDPNYYMYLLDVLYNFKPDVLLPWSDEEALEISNIGGRFDLFRRISICSAHDTVKTLNSKDKTYAALSGKPYCPRHEIAHTVNDIFRCATSMGHPGRPIVIKPDDGRGSRGVLTPYGNLLRRRDLEIYLKASGPCVVMPQYYTPFFDVDLYGGAVSVKQRVSHDGNLMAGLKVVDRLDVREVARDAARTLNLTAIHDLDIMVDERGQLKVIEVNSRPSSTLVVSMLAGVNLIDLAVEDILCR